MLARASDLAACQFCVQKEGVSKVVLIFIIVHSYSEGAKGLGVVLRARAVSTCVPCVCAYTVQSSFCVYSSCKQAARCVTCEGGQS